ncbi:MAG: hypothetical protein J6O50_04170 [Ruminiclostridium sp.]|nr:hypothetical protein [Ruminiclostridium sp.]
MNWMTFKDGTRIEIEEGASLGHIAHIATNEANALFVCEKCTPDNVSEIKFSQPGEDGAEIITGEYSGLLLSGAPTRATNEDGLSVTVTISLYEPSALELRVAALEEAQGVQDEAIDDLGGAVSDMMEG